VLKNDPVEGHLLLALSERADRFGVAYRRRAISPQFLRQEVEAVNVRESKKQTNHVVTDTSRVYWGVIPSTIQGAGSPPNFGTARIWNSARGASVINHYRREFLSLTRVEDERHRHPPMVFQAVERAGHHCQQPLHHAPADRQTRQAGNAALRTLWCSGSLARFQVEWLHTPRKAVEFEG
jgi:hypothetical protein